MFEGRRLRCETGEGGARLTGGPGLVGKREKRRQKDQKIACSKGFSEKRLGNGRWGWSYNAASRHIDQLAENERGVAVVGVVRGFLRVDNGARYG